MFLCESLVQTAPAPDETTVLFLPDRLHTNTAFLSDPPRARDRGIHGRRARIRARASFTRLSVGLPPTRPRQGKRAASYRYIIRNDADLQSRASRGCINAALERADRRWYRLGRWGIQQRKMCWSCSKNAYKGSKRKSCRGGGNPTQPESGETFLHLAVAPGSLLEIQRGRREMFITPSLVLGGLEIISISHYFSVSELCAYLIKGA